jgi:copper resistance protein C
MRAFLLALAIVAFAPAAPAFAHTELQKATPADKSILTTAPGQLQLTFSDTLSSLVTVVVTDGTRQKVATAKPAVDGPTATVRFTAPPANGTYTVAYRVVSNDGHTVQGTYAFRVAVPGATAAPTTTAPSTTTAPTTTPAATATVRPAAEATTTDDGSGIPTAVLVTIPVVVLLAAGGLVLARRRSG